MVTLICKKPPTPTVYIYIYIHTVSHRSEYTPHIFVNTLLYILYFIIYIHSSDQSHIPNKSLV